MLRKLLVLVALTACTSEHDGPFRDLPFADAAALAKQEQKIVLVDFFTTWCGPCKKLDATTWKDATVQAWLAEHTIALKIDAEKEPDLAQRFGVRAYPSIVLVKPDGTVVDSLVGYRDAQTFLSEVDDALAGKTALTRAREKLVGHEHDPIIRQRVAGELARAGRPDEALVEYLWCFDNGAKSRGYAGVRLSFLIGELGTLAKTHPPALRALEERRDAAEARVLAGSKKFEDASEAAAINREIGTAARALEFYERLRAAGPMTNNVKSALSTTVLEPLLEARRYQEVLDLFEKPEGFVTGSIRMHGSTAEMRSTMSDDRSTMSDDDEADMEKTLKKMIVTRCRPIHESLVGVGLGERAAAVADSLIEFAPSGMTYATLIESCARAGDVEAAKALSARGLGSSSGKEDKAAIEAALKSIESAK